MDVAEATFYRSLLGDCPNRLPGNGKKVYAGHSALKVDPAELLALLWANNA